MDFVTSIHRPTSGSGASSHEIFTAFRRHTDRLFELKRRADETIDDWSQDLIKQIEEHKMEQKQFVNKALKSRLQEISEMRDRLIADGDAYDQKNETAKIRRLIENCRNLNVKLVDIKFVPRDTMFVNVVSVVLEEPVNREEVDLSDAKAHRSARNSSGSLHEKTFDAKPLPSTPDQTKLVHPPNQTKPAHPPDQTKPAHPPDQTKPAHPPDQTKPAHPPGQTKPAHPPDQTNRARSPSALTRMSSFQKTSSTTETLVALLVFSIFRDFRCGCTMKLVNEIKKIFDGQISSLNDEKKENLKKITEWATKQKKEIDEHVAAQKQRLEQHYVSQKTTVEESCRQYVEKAAADTVKKNKDEAARLIDECKQLQFKLDDLTYCCREIKYLSVDNSNDSVTEEHRYEHSASESGKKTPRGGSANNEHTSTASTTAQPANGSRRSSATQTSPKLSCLTNVTDTTRSKNADESEMDNQCPVCFMIFSQSMNKDDREQHVNDHYVDD